MKFVTLIACLITSFNFCPGTLAALPDLVPIGLQVPPVITSEPNPTLTFVWGVTNQGSGEAPGRYDGVYLSLDPWVDTMDYQVSNWYVSGPTAPWTVNWGTNSVLLPIGWSGDYYLIFKTDLFNGVAESDENNNLMVAPFKFEARPADLAPLALQADRAVAGPPYTPLTVVWAVTNLGPGTARPPWMDTLYLTPSLSGKPDLTYLGQFYPTGQLAPGGVYWQTNTVQLPLYTSGTYYVLLKTDDTNALYEANFDNNTMAVPVTFTLQQPDLAPLAFLAPTNIAGPGSTPIQLVWGVTNQGTGTALAPWPDVVYLSTNSVLDEQSATLIDFTYQLDSVPPGGTYWTTNSVTAQFTHSGSYYLFFKTDPYRNLFELNSSNNLAVAPVHFTLQQADLLPMIAQVPLVITSTPNPQVVLTWGVTNQGTASAVGWWRDEIYLSTNATLDSADQCIYSMFSSGVDSQKSYWTTNSVLIPVTQSGSYYLLFRTGLGGTVGDADTNNNLIAVPISFTILAPDLAPASLQAPASFTGLPKPQLQLVWGVTNQGAGPAQGYWYDAVYFSSSPQWDSNATLVINTAKSGPLVSGQTYWSTNSVQVPGVGSGNYYFILKVNDGKSLIESDYSDDIMVTPIRLDISAPDLLPATSLVPSAITSSPNPSVTFVWGITNQGSGAATGTSWPNSIFLSTNSVRDGTETMVAACPEDQSIAPGQTLWLTNSMRLPIAASGLYYLLFEVNSGHWLLFEGDYSNNVAAVPVRFDVRRPDLTPIAFLAPSRVAAEPYPSVALVWGVTNQGTGQAEAPWGWSDQIYFSSSQIFDPTASSILSSSEPGPVAPGEVYWQTNSVRLPVSASGTYHLFLKLDCWQNLVESDRSNNVASVDLNFEARLPDLAPIDVSAPGVVTGPPNLKITYSWGITNQGVGAAVPPYYSSYADAVQLSTAPTWNSPYGSYVSCDYQYNPVAAGQSYRRTNTVRAPVTQSGTYYLIFNTDANRDLVESDYSNNVAALPITFNILPPDLCPVAFLAPSNVTSAPNPTITLVWGVTNQGAGPAIGADYWYDQVYLSQSPTWDFSGTCLDYAGEQGPIPAGGTYWRTNSFRLSVVKSGTYYLLFKTDYNDALYESNSSNNLTVVPIRFDIQPPDLAPITSLIPNMVTGAPNPRVTLVWGVTNQGTGPAIASSPWLNLAGFSKTPTLNMSGTSQFPPWYQSDPIEPGAAAWQTNTVEVPVTESGTYYLIFEANSVAYGRPYEANYSNNVVAVPVTFDIRKPDLAPLALEAPLSVSAPPNPVVTFVWGITNQGLGPALPGLSWGNWVDSLYVSTNATLGHGEKYISSLSPPGELPSGGSYWQTNSAHVPVAESGSYYILLQANDNRFLHESDYSNNVVAVPITFNIQPPDLAPLALQFPTVVTSTPNPKLTLVWGVTNQGHGLAEGNWYDSVFLSTNSAYDTSARTLTSRYEATPVPAGSAYWRTNAITFPVVQSGTYFLIFQVNSANSLIESDLSNNFLSKPITFTIQPPDLTPLALQAPASISGPPNPSFEIAWGVTNQGIGFLSQNQTWTDRVYLSTDTNRNRWGTPLLASDSEQGPIAPGQTYWRSKVVSAPVVQSGTYYLVFSTDDDNALFESNESNNIVAVPITFQINPPDLVPLGLQVPGVINSDPNPTIQFVWGVTNQGTGPVAPSYSWQDAVFLSRDALWDYTDTLLTSRSEPGPLPAGSSYWRTQTARVPVSASGDYYFILKTDTGSMAGDANYTNNTLAVPVHFNISMPDLAPVAFIVPTNVDGTPNSALTLVWGVTNQGAGASTSMADHWVDRVFLSPSSILDTKTAKILATVTSTGPLRPGETYWRTNIVRLPVSQDGTYYLFADINCFADNLVESDYSNNVADTQVTFHITAPDLAPILFSCPTQVTSAFPTVTLGWGVTNQGPGPAIGGPFPWTDAVSLYTSNSTIRYWSFVQQWCWPQTNVLAPGQTYWTTNTLTLPISQDGDYRLTFTTDLYDDLGESNKTNNALSVQISANLAPPIVEPIYLAINGPVTGPQNPAASVVWGVTNLSASPAWAGKYGNWQDRLYLSTNALLDSSAVPIVSWQQTNFIPANGSYWNTNYVRLPARASGDYYLILQVDAYNVLAQAAPSNHVASVPVSITVLPLPDLAPTLFLAPTILTTAPNPSVTLVWGVTNQGAGPAVLQTAWSDGLYLSRSPVPDGSELLVGSYPGTNSLAPGAVYWRTNTAILPVNSSGTWYLICKANCFGSVPESDFGNNISVTPTTFDVPVPDLAPLSLQAPGYVAGVPHPRITVIAGVTNQGPGLALAANDMIYLSATPRRDASARLVATWPRATTVLAGGTYWITNTVELPVTDSGQYYLVFETDGDNCLRESNLLNNSAVVPIDLELSLVPDLTVASFLAPAFITGPVNPPIQLVWHVKNQGLGPAAPPWSDAVLFSTNFGPSASVVLARFAETNPVPAGADYWRTNTVTLPLTQSGSFYLRFRADLDGDLYEFDESNNEAYDVVSLTVINSSPAALGPARKKDDGSFELAVTGALGLRYTLQSSTNLLDWAPVCDFTCTQPTTWVQDPAADHSIERFYRVVPCGHP